MVHLARPGREVTLVVEVFLQQDSSLPQAKAAVARAVYFVRLDTPGFRSVKKAVVAR